jgi:hypothetical protein
LDTFDFHEYLPVVVVLVVVVVVVVVAVVVVVITVVVAVVAAVRTRFKRASIHETVCPRIMLNVVSEGPCKTGRSPLSACKDFLLSRVVCSLDVA